jgi:hypothetical protein
LQLEETKIKQEFEEAQKERDRVKNTSDRADVERKLVEEELERVQKEKADWIKKNRFNSKIKGKSY